jgi:Flp pilus assembly protein TadG
VQLFPDQTGSALIEFSVTMPLLVLLFIGGVSYSLVIQQRLAITDAAAAGAKYGANGHISDVAGMQTVATNSAGNISGLNVTASSYCACSPGGAQASCALGTCANPVEYVQVTTSAVVPVLWNVPGISTSVSLTATSLLRVPWGG